MADSFTEITGQSWFGRIGDSIKGILFGGVLFLLSFVVLFWNEGRAVQTAKSLDEGGKVVISVDAGKVDPANEGKLVHISGEATTAQTLADAQFGVSAAALKLRRQAQMYQWKENKSSETRNKLGGG